MRTKTPLFTIATAALVVGLSGCAASGAVSGTPTTATTPHTTSTQTQAPAPTGAPGAAQVVKITISNFAYKVPATVAPGAKVTVTNLDSQNHTLTSKTPGAFAVTVPAGGGTATFTAPTKPGSYPFGCTFHANMMGTLVVT